MNIFKKLKEGLTKTRQNIVAGFDSIFSGHKAINDDFYDELEEVMIMGDMGVRATDEILEDLKVKVKEQKIKDPAECRQLLIDTIKEKIDLGENAYEYENTKSALLIIGVNGVGKTTSVGKLAASLKSKGKKVILAAADTFRAGAIDQLKIWGKRAGVDVVAQQEGADPGAVIYDAVQASKARGADVLIADTAGRLHNKKNLMNELSKIDRIIEREYPDCYRENLIVLDATTGQNAISQLREFSEVTDITGIILTKMDGTAKGGIIVAIQAEFGIPVKYIGVGEKIEDLQKFDSKSFVNALFDVDLSDDELEAFEYEEIDEEALAAESYADEDTVAGDQSEEVFDTTDQSEYAPDAADQSGEVFDTGEQTEDVLIAEPLAEDTPEDDTGAIYESTAYDDQRDETPAEAEAAAGPEIAADAEDVYVNTGNGSETAEKDAADIPDEYAETEGREEMAYDTPEAAADDTDTEGDAYEEDAEDIAEETFTDAEPGKPEEEPVTDAEETEKVSAEENGSAFEQEDEIPEGIFEDISDNDDESEDEYEEEYEEEDDDSQPEGEYHDKAYEAFLGKTNAGERYDQDAVPEDDTFADEEIEEYETDETVSDSGSEYNPDDNDDDSRWEEEPKKRKGLFGLFKRRK